jgi:hypothetical protein
MRGGGGSPRVYQTRVSLLFLLRFLKTAICLAVGWHP